MVGAKVNLVHFGIIDFIFCREGDLILTAAFHLILNLIGSIYKGRLQNFTSSPVTTKFYKQNQKLTHASPVA